MSRKTTTNTTSTTENTTVASLFQTATSSTASRAIPGAAELQVFSQTAGNSIFMQLSESTDAELMQNVAGLLASGDYSDACKLINQFYTDKQISDGTVFLKDCNTTELDRLLESRRSDRSKARKAGLTTCFPRFLADVVAEMAIRLASGKAYAVSSTGHGTIDIEALAADQVALNKKIRSLQSRISVLRSKGQYAPADWEGFKQIEALKQTVDELMAHRISTSNRTTKTVVDKRAVATAISNMSADELAELQAKIAEMQAITVEAK